MEKLIKLASLGIVFVDLQTINKYDLEELAKRYSEMIINSLEKMPDSIDSKEIKEEYEPTIEDAILYNKLYQDDFYKNDFERFRKALYEKSFYLAKKLYIKDWFSYIKDEEDIPDIEMINKMCGKEVYRKLL